MLAMSVITADVLVTRRQAGKGTNRESHRGLYQEGMGTTGGSDTRKALSKIVNPTDLLKIIQVCCLHWLLFLFPVFDYTQKTRLTLSQKQA